MNQELLQFLIDFLRQQDSAQSGPMSNLLASGQSFLDQDKTSGIYRLNPDPIQDIANYRVNPTRGSIFQKGGSAGQDLLGGDSIYVLGYESMTDSSFNSRLRDEYQRAIRDFQHSLERVKEVQKRDPATYFSSSERGLHEGQSMAFSYLANPDVSFESASVDPFVLLASDDHKEEFEKFVKNRWKEQIEDYEGAINEFQRELDLIPNSEDVPVKNDEFTREFNRRGGGKEVLSQYYNNVNYIPVGPGGIEDALSQVPKGSSIMFMDHSGNNLFGVPSDDFLSFVADRNPVECIGGTCFGEKKYGATMRSLMPEANIILDKDAWTGFDSSRSGVEAVIANTPGKRKYGGMTRRKYQNGGAAATVVLPEVQVGAQGLIDPARMQAYQDSLLMYNAGLDYARHLGVANRAPRMDARHGMRHHYNYYDTKNREKDREAIVNRYIRYGSSKEEAERYADRHITENKLWDAYEKTGIENIGYHPLEGFAPFFRKPKEPRGQQSINRLKSKELKALEIPRKFPEPDHPVYTKNERVQDFKGIPNVKVVSRQRKKDKQWVPIALENERGERIPYGALRRGFPKGFQYQSEGMTRRKYQGGGPAIAPVTNYLLPEVQVGPGATGPTTGAGRFTSGYNLTPEQTEEYWNQLDEYIKQYGEENLKKYPWQYQFYIENSPRIGSFPASGAQRGATELEAVNNALGQVWQIPQSMMMAGLTDQDFRGALGELGGRSAEDQKRPSDYIANPYLGFAADMFLDPMNVGAGALSAANIMRGAIPKATRSAAGELPEFLVRMARPDEDIAQESIEAFLKRKKVDPSTYKKLDDIRNIVVEDFVSKNPGVPKTLIDGLSESLLREGIEDAANISSKEAFDRFGKNLSRALEIGGSTYQSGIDNQLNKINTIASDYEKIANRYIDYVSKNPGETDADVKAVEIFARELQNMADKVDELPPDKKTIQELSRATREMQDLRRGIDELIDRNFVPSKSSEEYLPLTDPRNVSKGGQESPWKILSDIYDGTSVFKDRQLEFPELNFGRMQSPGKIVEDVDANKFMGDMNRLAIVGPQESFIDVYNPANRNIQFNPGIQFPAKNQMGGPVNSNIMGNYAFPSQEIVPENIFSLNEIPDGNEYIGALPNGDMVVEFKKGGKVCYGIMQYGGAVQRRYERLLEKKAKLEGRGKTDSGRYQRILDRIADIQSGGKGKTQIGRALEGGADTILSVLGAGNVIQGSQFDEETPDWLKGTINTVGNIGRTALNVLAPGVGTGLNTALGVLGSLGGGQQPMAGGQMMGAGIPAGTIPQGLGQEPVYNPGNLLAGLQPFAMPSMQGGMNPLLIDITPSSYNQEGGGVQFVEPGFEYQPDVFSSIFTSKHPGTQDDTYDFPFYITLYDLPYKRKFAEQQIVEGSTGIPGEPTKEHQKLLGDARDFVKKLLYWGSDKLEPYDNEKGHATPIETYTNLAKALQKLPRPKNRKEIDAWYEKADPILKEHYDPYHLYRLKRAAPATPEFFRNMGSPPINQMGGSAVGRMGYRDDSPFRNAPMLNIPGNNITMNGVSKPLMLMPNSGSPVIAPPNSGNYRFPGASMVTEIPLSRSFAGIYQMGGPVMAGPQLVPIQAEKGEMLIQLDNTITSTNARKSHKAMDDDEVTDIVPEGTYVASDDRAMKINYGDVEDIIIGVRTMPYEEYKKGKMPEEIKFVDLWPNNSKRAMTPAELATAIRNKFPTREIDGEDYNYFRAVTNYENLDSRTPYLQIVKLFNEAARMNDQDVQPFQHGGTVKYQGGGFANTAMDILGILGSALPLALNLGSGGNNQLNADPRGVNMMLGSVPLNSLGLTQNVRAQENALDRAIGNYTGLGQNLNQFATGQFGTQLFGRLGQNLDLPRFNFDTSRLQNFNTQTPRSFIDAVSMPNYDTRSILQEAGGRGSAGILGNLQSNLIRQRNEALTNQFNQNRLLDFQLANRLTDVGIAEDRANMPLQLQEQQARNARIAGISSDAGSLLGRYGDIQSSILPQLTGFDISRAQLAGQIPLGIAQNMFNAGSILATLPMRDPTDTTDTGGQGDTQYPPNPTPPDPTKPPGPWSPPPWTNPFPLPPVRPLPPVPPRQWGPGQIPGNQVPPAPGPCPPGTCFNFLTGNCQPC